MKKHFHSAFVASIFISSLSLADTLKGDAILCETESPLAILSQSNFSGLPGSVVMKRAIATVEIAALKVKAQNIMRDGAAREDAIRSNSRSLWRGSTPGAANAIAEQKEIEDSAKPYEDFTHRCVATPVDEQPAVILERRPISGTVKVKTALNGHEFEFWTVGAYLRGD